MNLDRVDAGLLPPCTLIAGTVSVRWFRHRGATNSSLTFCRVLAVHEAKMVGIGGFSPPHQTRLLGDEAEMRRIAVARRGDRLFYLWMVQDEREGRPRGPPRT